MQDLGLGSILFSERDLDAALSEVSIDTSLSIEVQRSLASRVLITASLASAIDSEDAFSRAVSQLGAAPQDPEQVSFLALFSDSIVRDLREELGDQCDHIEQIGVMTRRIGTLAA